jgi:hypothetical protein
MDREYDLFERITWSGRETNTSDARLSNYLRSPNFREGLRWLEAFQTFGF